jgi:hypothetical protein
VFDPSQQRQYDDGYNRHSTAALGESNPIETSQTSLISRMNAQVKHDNDHRDVQTEPRVYRDRAAATIQAAYRGYTVRKSLLCLNEKEKYLYNEFTQRVNQCISSADVSRIL